MDWSESPLLCKKGARKNGVGVPLHSKEGLDKEALSYRSPVTSNGQGERLLPTRDSSTTAEAAWLVAQGHPHGLAQVRLLKLLWIGELRYYERFSTRLTPANWWRWEHGPYSKDVINTVRDRSRNFSAIRDPDLVGANGLLISAKPSAPGDTLDRDARETISEVLDMYSSYSNSEIIAEVYADPFFEATPYGADFDFAKLSGFRKEISAASARRLLAQESRPVQSVEALFE
jgi:uncharacterized phage-associated protein